jgi:hypothetical protein
LDAFAGAAKGTNLNKIDEFKDTTLEIGPTDRVILKKIFGPTVFMDIRITQDLVTCEWVIERSTILPCPNPEYAEESTDWQVWVEWCRFPAQYDWEFKK